MKIAFLTPEYVTEHDSFDGGLANYLQRVAQGMKKRGHQVEIFTLSDRNETIVHNRIIVHRVKVQSRLINIINHLTLKRFGSSLQILFSSWWLRRRLIRRFRKQQFDIIQPSSYLACGLFLTFRRPTTIITRVSSYEPLWREYYRKPLSLDQRLMEWLEILAVRRSNAVYAPSKLLSRHLREKESIKVDVVRPPYFLDTTKFDERIYNNLLLGKKYFLFFGTIGFLKGGEVLAQTLPRVLDKSPDLYFVFAGKDRIEFKKFSMLKRILTKAGKSKKQIITLGILEHSQLYPIIKNSHAVVLPSLIDNLPNTMLEAMSFGKVIIGTRGASFEELIEDGISGILVEPNNPSELSQAMNRVWNMSNKEREKIGKSAQERITLISPEITCKKLEQYYLKFNHSLEA